MVPRARPRSYYGQPIIKEPVWSRGDRLVPVRRRAGRRVGAAGVARAGPRQPALGSPRLAGRAARSGDQPGASDQGPGASGAVLEHAAAVQGHVAHEHGVLGAEWVWQRYRASRVNDLFGWFPRLGKAGKVGSALLGHGLASYTAILLADTAVPVWHEAADELPFVFVGSAAASAGAAGAVLAPIADAGPARRLMLLGATLEQAATYRDGAPAR